MFPPESEIVFHMKHNSDFWMKNQQFYQNILLNTTSHIWAYPMKVITETRRVHLIRYLPFFSGSFGFLQQ